MCPSRLLCETERLQRLGLEGHALSGFGSGFSHCRIPIWDVALLKWEMANEIRRTTPSGGEDRPRRPIDPLVRQCQNHGHESTLGSGCVVGQGKSIQSRGAWHGESPLACAVPSGSRCLFLSSKPCSADRRPTA